MYISNLLSKNKIYISFQTYSRICQGVKKEMSINCGVR